MPHDRDGKTVNVRDEVLVPCRVTAIHDTDDYCNLNLETLHPMYPGTWPSQLTLNVRQVIKVAP